MIDPPAFASGDADASAHPGIVSVRTRPAKTLPGLVGVLLALVGLGMIAGGGVGVTVAGGLAALIPIGAILFILVWPGQYVVQPNPALVLIMFGRYRGTVTNAGWYQVNPFTRAASRKVSLRVHNFTTSVSKVNDAEGNPIEISAVVEDALELLSERSVVELDQDAKASLVANLLVVLTSEQQTTPVVNTGSGR